MRLLVIGRTGQLARELAARAGADVAVTCLGREAADLTDPAACAEAVAAHLAARGAMPVGGRPGGVMQGGADAVINAAAYTAVDRAETEEAAAALVNAAAPAAMARAAAARNVPFLHVSTDYVFAGDGEAPWRPGDPTGPLGAYGRTKLAGEEAVRAAGGPHVILRTSWVFSAHGANFVKTMLRLARERDHLRIVADQTGGPTAAGDIADALIVIARALAADPGLSGTYHYAGAPDVSWADFARAILAAAGLPAAVEGIPSRAYPTPARRPANSRLDCTATTAAFGLSRPGWRESLIPILRDLGDGT